MRESTMLFRFIHATQVVLLTALLAGCQDDVDHVYLTWSEPDTSTTMTVHYNTEPSSGGAHVYYDTVSHRRGKPSDYAFHMAGTSKALPGIDRRFHEVQLSGLAPGTTYHFIAGDSETGFSKELKFRTIPDDGQPIRFVTGGDMGTNLALIKLNTHAARQNPDFAVIGGDIAYANGELENWGDWKFWLNAWEQTMVTPDGHLIPMVVALGNHEVLENTGVATESAPFYATLFPQGNPELTYFKRTFGGQFVFLVLDTNHVFTHEAQENFIREVLLAHQDLAARYAVYHVPLYPGHRGFAGGLAGRRSWAPLFEEHDLTIGFENHDHVLKRTKPLRAEEVVSPEEGVVYLGDGAWGRSPRDAESRYYLVDGKSIARRHFWFVEVSGNTARYEAIGTLGRTLDEFEQNLN